MVLAWYFVSLSDDVFEIKTKYHANTIIVLILLKSWVFKMTLIFGVCFILYFFTLSAGSGFWTEVSLSYICFARSETSTKWYVPLLTSCFLLFWESNSISLTMQHRDFKVSVACPNRRPTNWTYEGWLCFWDSDIGYGINVRHIHQIIFWSCRQYFQETD